MAITDRDDLMSIRDMLTDALERSGSLYDAISRGDTDTALNLLSGIRELMRDSKGATYCATDNKPAPTSDRIQDIWDEMSENREYNASMVRFYQDRIDQTCSHGLMRSYERSRDFFKAEERKLQTAIDVLSDYI